MSDHTPPPGGPDDDPVMFTAEETDQILDRLIERARRVSPLERVVMKLIRVQDHRMAISLTPPEAAEYDRLKLMVLERDEYLAEQAKAAITGFAEPPVANAAVNAEPTQAVAP